MSCSVPPGRTAESARIPSSLRVDAGIGVEVGMRDGRSFLAALGQRGGLRAKMPNRRDGAVEIVMVNTGGGVAGGDRHDIRVVAAAGADVVVSTVAAEKLYRSDGATARIAVSLAAAAGARLAWLPQETIFHDGARLERRLDVDLAAGAEITLAEMLVFGRTAHGEHPGSIDLADRWRLRCDGRLVFAEALRLAPDFQRLRHDPAVFAGANAVATIVQSGPEAGSRLDAVRAVLPAGAAAGASAWGGLLVVRCVADGAEMLRRIVAPALAVLTGRPVPRVWGT
jgi:urease accessory protein